MKFSKLLKMNSPEWRIMAIGCFGALLYGAYPFLFAICLGKFFKVSVILFFLLCHFSCVPFAHSLFPISFYLFFLVLFSISFLSLLQNLFFSFFLFLLFFLSLFSDFCFHTICFLPFYTIKSIDFSPLQLWIKSVDFPPLQL